MKSILQLFYPLSNCLQVSFTLRRTPLWGLFSRIHHCVNPLILAYFGNFKAWLQAAACVFLWRGCLGLLSRSRFAFFSAGTVTTWQAAIPPFLQMIHRRCRRWKVSNVMFVTGVILVPADPRPGDLRWSKDETYHFAQGLLDFRLWFLGFGATDCPTVLYQCAQRLQA